MEFIRELFEQQPLVALFLTVAIGYLLGEISIKGFSLGVGAVLFVALGVGWFAPKAAPAAMVGNVGLALFLYAVGIMYGKQFFTGLTSASGLKANSIALVGVFCCGAVCLLFITMADLKTGYALGLFAGSGTSTPTLQVAITTLGNDDPAIGYSVSYPFGVAGPILFLYFSFAILKPKIAVPSSAGMELLEIALQRKEYFGRRLGEVMAVLPTDVQIVALRRDQHNQPASPDIVIAENDVLLVVAPTKASVDAACKLLGEAAPGHIVQDRRDLDYLRVFASRPAVVGRMLGESGAAGRPGVDRDPGEPGRYRTAATPGPGARIRRSCGPARQPRGLPGRAQVFRRLDQGYRRVQLHLDRPGDGPWRAAWRGHEFRYPVPAALRWGCPVC